MRLAFNAHAPCISPRPPLSTCFPPSSTTAPALIAPRVHCPSTRILGRRLLRRCRLLRPQNPLQCSRQPASRARFFLSSSSVPPFTISSTSLEENGGIHPFVAIHNHQRNLASLRAICRSSELPFSLARSPEQCARPSRTPACLSMTLMGLRSLAAQVSCFALLSFVSRSAPPRHSGVSKRVR